MRHPDEQFECYRISIDGFNKFADPWLAANATVTQGNNVDAYTDDNAPEGFSANDLRASVNGASTFDYTYGVQVPACMPDPTRNIGFGRM